MNTEECGGEGEETCSSSGENKKLSLNTNALDPNNEQQASDNWRRPPEDDDGSRYFMSEPSVSEDGSEHPSMRGLAILSPQDSLSETLSPSSAQKNRHMMNESDMNTSPPTTRPQSPSADLVLSPPRAGTPGSTGGTTSLSSRESPFWTRQYHFMAYPPGESDHSAGGSFEGSRQNAQVETSTARSSSANNHRQARGSTCSDVEADVSSQNDSNAAFLYHLRQQSVGAFMVADPGTNGVANEQVSQRNAHAECIMRSAESGGERSSGEFNGSPDKTTCVASGRKLLDRHRRKKSSSHRRTRSGDDVAAMIMTGGTEWRGMEVESFPAPPLFGHSSGDDEDGQEAALPNVSSSFGKEINSRWFQKGRNESNYEVHASETLQKDQGADLWSLSDTTLSPRTRDDRNSEGDNTTSRFPSYVDHRSSYCGSVSTLGYGGAGSRRSLMSDHERKGRSDEPNTVTGSDSDDPQSEKQKRKSTINEIIGVSENSSTSSRSSSKFSWISGPALRPSSVSRQTSPHPPPHPTFRNPPRSQVVENKADDSSSCESESSYYSSEEFSDENECHVSTQRNTYQDCRPQQRGDPNFPVQVKRVLGPLHSPFANIGKTTQKFINKQNYAPTTFAEDADKYPTFICPRCKTPQRAFFSTSTAPTQDSPAGYLAFYFFIYVIASLYIFGLQEGWNALDCVYFAVITLTTAGLGDFVPTSDGAKVICSIFIYFGVACIGLLLGSYLAGSLDDVSRKEAQAHQVDSCVNCNRIKALKASSKARRKSRASVKSVNSHAFMSERPGHPSFQSHQAVYERAEKRRKPPSNMEMPRFHPGNQSFGTRQPTGPIQGGERNDSHQSVESQFGRDRNSQPPSLDVIGTTGRHDSAFSSPPLTANYGAPVSPVALGSPVTARIMHRQRHTRHASLDIASDMFNEENHFVKRERRFSDDGGIGATIPEGQPAAPQSFFGRDDDSSAMDDDEDSDSDESISDYSESSFLDAQDMKQPISRVKTAKYVFLTLKQAVMNSTFIIAIGSTGFYFIEKMSAIDSFYFTTVLLTTVGYGDLVPVTAPGKLFATVYVLVAGTVLLHNMSTISMIPLELRKRRIERAVLTQFGDQLDDATLRELATGPLVRRLQLSAQTQSGLDECTREMFALAMLVRLGKVTEHEIRMTFAAFRRLDVGNDGILNSQDIIVGMMQKRRQSSVNNLVAFGQEAAARTRASTSSSTSNRPWYFFGRQGSIHELDESPESVPFQYATEEDVTQSEQQALLQSSMSDMDNLMYSSMQMSRVRLNSYDANMNTRDPQAVDVESGYDYQYRPRTSSTSF